MSKNLNWCLTYLTKNNKRKLYNLTYNGEIIVKNAPYAVCASKRKVIPSNEKHLVQITPA